MYDLKLSLMVGSLFTLALLFSPVPVAAQVDCGFSVPCYKYVDAPNKSLLELNNTGAGSGISGSGKIYGVQGSTSSTNSNHAGVYGYSDAATGVFGFSYENTGVIGSGKLKGVKAVSGDANGYGVHALSGGNGVYGQSNNQTSSTKAGLYGINMGPGYGVYASSKNGRAACFAINNSLSGKEALWVQTSGTGWTGYFKGLGTQSKGVYIKTASAGQPALLVEGGTKSAVVPTSQGRKVLYAEEASEVYFSDYGFGRLKNGRAVIPIDLLFAETVNLAQPYHVFVQAYGNAELYVSRRTPTGFEIALRDGDANAEFSYRLVAKRRGFEQARLEQAPGTDQDANLYPEKDAEKLAAAE